MWKLSLLFFGMTLFASEELKMRPSPVIIEAPYGSWASPISADMIVADGVNLGGVREVGGAVYFSEQRPSEKGRVSLVRWNGDFEDLISLEYNVRTTVHEYGGGSSLIVGDTIYFSNFSDQQIYQRDKQGVITKLTDEKNSRFADGCSFGNWLFYVMETHGEKVDNCLVAIDRNSGEVRKIAEGCDFYSGPRVSPNGNKLAYYCWNDPNMPWDGGELRVAEIYEDGTLGEPEKIAGGDKESICQHSWSPNGLLYYVSDRSGWWNLYCENDALFPMDAEFGSPQWVFGQSFFDFWKNKIVCVYSQLGVDHLAILEKGQLTPIDVPFSSIKKLSITGDHLYFVGAAPESPLSIVQYNLKTKKLKIIKSSRNLKVSLDSISFPEAIEFPTTDGLTAHAFYYPPKNGRYKGLPGEFPPLLVMSHGGPTAHVTPEFDLQIQYWTSRGFAVVDVNYGGSSGYGREYRDRLIGKWGVVDVDDCTNAALYCAQEGLADRNRLCIEGGSAGGFTTLACLTFRDVFKAGASLFGVSDLVALTRDTHKFEARYLDSLIGPYPATKDLYLERSPIEHTEQIHCPIILLQGDEDKIVPPAQSEMMYQSLLKRGIPTAYLLFEKEQHGFRQSSNIKRALEAEAFFFSKIFGFKLADSIEPVKIENLK